MSVTDVQAVSAELPAIPDCPDCRVPLDLHQHDETIPDRVLGTCAGCRRLYFIRQTYALDERGWPTSSAWDVIGPAGLAAAG